MSKLYSMLPLGGFEKHWENVSIIELEQIEIVSLAVPLGEHLDFEKNFEKLYEQVPPAPGTSTKIENGRILWVGQNQYFLILEGVNEYADIKVSNLLQNSAHTTLQSDSWAALKIVGTGIFPILERFVPLNLKDFKVGSSHRTQAHHMALIITCLTEYEFLLLTPRSSCSSFLETLTDILDRS